MKLQKKYFLHLIPVHVLMFLGLIDGNVQKMPHNSLVNTLKERRNSYETFSILV